MVSLLLLSLPRLGARHRLSSVSLLHFDGANGSTTFTDEKGKTWTANGAAQISTAQSKFGGASGYFDGSGSWIQTPAGVDFNFGTGDFTFEFFINYSSLASYVTIYNYGYNLVGGLILQSDPTTGRLILYHWPTGTGTAIVAESSASVSIGTWYHIAIVRFGNDYSIYRDGVAVGSATVGGVNIGQATGPMVIGGGSATGVNNYFLNGYVDEFRVTKGIARYTANFTPPSTAFPNI